MKEFSKKNLIKDDTSKTSSTANELGLGESPY